MQHLTDVPGRTSDTNQYRDVVLLREYQENDGDTDTLI